MAFNPNYIIGIGLIAIGAAFAYIAGEQDGEKLAAKRHESEVWQNANHTKVGALDDVPSVGSGDNPTGDAT